MDSGRSQVVLRCKSCNKPFDKASTLKRHGYYCRSRRSGSDLTPRGRSCVACASRKARCDNERPACSRCASKDIQCHYPGMTIGRARHSSLRDDGGSNESMQSSFLSTNNPSYLDGSQDLDHSADLMLDPATTLSVPDPGTDFLDWDSFDVNLVDFSSPQKTTDFRQLSPSQPPFLVPELSAVADRSLEVHSLLKLSSYPSIPLQPSGMVRSLVQRPEIGSGRQRIAHLMLCTLKSYPLMMLRRNTLPPHIHPQSVTSDIQNVDDDDMESLDNCMSLMNMISNRVLGSRKLFWRNVRMECERLYQEHARLNKTALLASMQALSIYILVRLEEGENEHNNLDSLLVATVTILAKQFNGIDHKCATEFESCDYTPRMRWDDWILQESVRRLCVIYQIVGMLIYFEPAAMCDVPMDLFLAPLPAKKQLWEAKDEVSWRSETEQESKVQNSFGLAANGDLVGITPFRPDRSDESSQSHRGSPYSRSRSETNINWQEWCSGMDGFGGLVMLASSLLTQ